MQEKDETLRTQISSGFYYSGFSSSNSLMIPDVESEMQRNFEETSSEHCNLQSGMEVLGFRWKDSNLQQRDRNSIALLKWGDRGSSSKTIVTESNGFYQPNCSRQVSNTLDEIGAADSVWPYNRLLVDNSSSPCGDLFGANERPSHGLALSLSPSIPSHIGLQSFEVRETYRQINTPVSSNYGVGFFGKSTDLYQQHQTDLQVLQHQLKNSKYLAATQELLNELCNLGSKQKSNSSDGRSKNKPHKTNLWEGVSLKKQSLYSLNLLELQQRKTKLASMLEQVESRYKQYQERMLMVVSSFEAVAGSGAASVYSNLTSKTIARHFRCLRDGISSQIEHTKKAIGEKEPVASKMTTCKTPRLKLLEQTLRQRDFRRTGVMDGNPWKPLRGLPERSVSILRSWLFEHFLHPYPSDVDKLILARQTGLSKNQVSNWFINARVRLWKPMVEEMYLQETKEQQDNDNKGGSSSDNNKTSNGISVLNHNSHPHSQHSNQSNNHGIQLYSYEEKPTLQHQQKLPRQQQNLTKAENFGPTSFDFSSYGPAVSYTDTNSPQWNSISRGVSSTLGLQMHDGDGIGLSFTPTASQRSLLLSRQHAEDTQPFTTPF